MYTVLTHDVMASPAMTQSAGSSFSSLQIINWSLGPLQESSMTKAAASSTADVAGNNSLSLVGLVDWSFDSVIQPAEK